MRRLLPFSLVDCRSGGFGRIPLSNSSMTSLAENGFSARGTSFSASGVEVWL
jgi:hypothetical protein